MSMVGAEAEVLLSDDFNYPDGALITVGSTTWAHHSGNISGEVQVLSGRALLTESESEDVNAALTPSGDTLYAGLTVRFTTLPSSGGDYFCHFKNSSTTYRPKVFATTSGAATGQLRLGISNGSNSPDQILGVDLLLNTDYRLVFRYTISSPSGTLWVNPASEGDPFVTAADSASSTTIVAFALRQSSGIGDIEIDNLAIGTSFGDVVANATPQAPVILTQPQSQSVIEGATVNFSVVASGEAPLSYQWFFNGTNLLAGATEASLGFTNVDVTAAGSYSVTVSNAVGMSNSLSAGLSVVMANATFSVLDYNVKGNSAADWSTNSPQVRAIGRQVEYLDPDIITFQEIPYTNTWQMTNFVIAFRPGFHLADQSGTDGYIRSVILSRYPINRSQKWLDGVSLVPFGYNGNFTRDLFEAEIAVPGYPQPVHVFTTHLKSGQAADASARRAAEANAISNFFVTGYLTTNASHPYLLSGDMNEDIFRPPSSNPQTIQRLTSQPTGLRLTTPQNPYDGSELTISIQSGMYARYDYILPCGLLFSNMVNSEVFRSDKLPAPPPPLLRTDSATASDHLPVMMVFGIPVAAPFHLRSISVSNEVVALTWETTPGGIYDIEGTSSFVAWTSAATNLVATGTNLTHAVTASHEEQFYRVVRRQP